MLFLQSTLKNCSLSVSAIRLNARATHVKSIIKLNINMDFYFFYFYQINVKWTKKSCSRPCDNWTRSNVSRLNASVARSCKIEFERVIFKHTGQIDRKHSLSRKIVLHESYMYIIIWIYYANRCNEVVSDHTVRFETFSKISRKR